MPGAAWKEDNINMIGLGTLINCAAIIIGGILGLIIGKALKPRFQELITVALGLCVMFMSIADVMKEMLTVSSDGKITAGGTYMLIASMVLGAVLGELINIEKHIEQFGIWLKKKTKSTSDGGFVDGFVTASLTVCVGAMAVLGALNDGISGDFSILATKSILDCVIVLIMSSSCGKGPIFSAIPVLILQGTVTLSAKLISPLMTAAALSNLTLTGGVLIFCVGINLVFKTKIKVGNLLPAIIFAVAWAFIPYLNTL